LKKKTRKIKKQGALVVNARDRKSVDLTDVEKAAKDAKRTQASKATIVVGPNTEVAQDVKEFAAENGVQIATMTANND